MSSDRRPLVLAVSGSKNAGKTHLVEQLIAELVARGVDLAVVKHDAHAHMKIDYEGKDTWRYRQAGAPRIGVIGPLGRVVMDYSQPFLTGQPAEEAIQRLFPDVVLILVEGFKDHALPRIKLFAAHEGPATHVAFRREPARDEEIGPVESVPLTLDACLEFIETMLGSHLGSAPRTNGRSESHVSRAEIPGG